MSLPGASALESIIDMVPFLFLLSDDGLRLEW